MKPIMTMVVASVFTFIVPMAYAAPASATHKPHAADFSAAKKKPHQTRNYNGAYRAYGQGYAPAYRRPYAADPSFDPYGRPYQPNVYSPCTIDLGYGRFTSCDR